MVLSSGLPILTKEIVHEFLFLYFFALLLWTFLLKERKRYCKMVVQVEKLAKAVTLGDDE